MSRTAYSKPLMQRFDVVKASAGYVVRDPDGRIVSAPMDGYQQALTMRDVRQAAHDARLQRRKRPCMTCREDFFSEGIHNRLCSGCRHKDAGEAVQRPELPARRAGAR